MADGQYWMTPDHSGPGITHDGADLVAQLRLIAMDRAVTAGGFVFLERAARKPESCVFHQFPAFMTDLPLGMMMVFAIKSDHQLNGLLLSFHAGRNLGHRFHHDMALKSPLFVDLFNRIRQDQLAGCSGFDAQAKGNLTPAAALFFILFDKCFRLLILKMSQDKNKGHFFFT